MKHILEQLNATLVEVNLYHRDGEFEDMEHMIKLLRPLLKITETVSLCNSFKHPTTASSPEATNLIESMKVLMALKLTPLL